MRRLLIVVAMVLLAGCSSAPEKPDPTPLERITEAVKLDVVESTSLGGGDQTGLSPASDGEVIAAASTVQKDLREGLEGTNNKAAAAAVGKAVER